MGGRWSAENSLCPDDDVRDSVPRTGRVRDYQRDGELWQRTRADPALSRQQLPKQLTQILVQYHPHGKPASDTAHATMLASRPTRKLGAGATDSTEDRLAPQGGQ